MRRPKPNAPGPPKTKTAPKSRNSPAPFRVSSRRGGPPAALDARRRDGFRRLQSQRRGLALGVEFGARSDVDEGVAHPGLGLGLGPGRLFERAFREVERRADAVAARALGL